MMNLKKVFSIVVGVVILIQLCDSNEINTEKNYSNDAMDQPSDVESVNVSDEKANLTESTTMTSKFKSDIKIDDQKYTQNTSGEYKHQILFNNGNWHAEHGEYENHNGTVVFVVRGAFSYHTKEGTYKTTFYVVDEFGYHVIEPPPEIPIIQDGGGQVDYRPDVGTSTECGDSKENYCIDPKLLALLVG